MFQPIQRNLLVEVADGQISAHRREPHDVRLTDVALLAGEVGVHRSAREVHQLDGVADVIGTDRQDLRRMIELGRGDCGRQIENGFDGFGIGGFGDLIDVVHVHHSLFAAGGQQSSVRTDRDVGSVDATFVVEPVDGAMHSQIENGHFGVRAVRQ